MAYVYTDSSGNPSQGSGKIDYVAAWFYKAAQLVFQTPIQVAFVVTNSITQGEQVSDVWQPLYDLFKISINFAYTTFKWSNEAKGKAAVHCVIVGFGWKSHEKKQIINPDGILTLVPHINPYLLEALTVFVTSRSNPIGNVSLMTKGSQPTDDGNFFLTSDEKNELLSIYPDAKDLIRPFLGAKEFLQDIPRFCIWLKDVSPSRYSKIPPIMSRIKAVREFRLTSSKAQTREDANNPTLFQEVRQPSSRYILVPSTSSENREYVPIGFIEPDVICGNQNLMIPRATLYEFGVITSSTHMAWMRTVAGRLKSDYRYSAQIVYNNFPWPGKTAESVSRIEKSAQAVLDARANFPDRFYADLYDPLFMPPDLRKAHQILDKEVFRAYGKDSTSWPTESAIVADLMMLYQKMSN